MATTACDLRTGQGHEQLPPTTRWCTTVTDGAVCWCRVIRALAIYTLLLLAGTCAIVALAVVTLMALRGLGYA